MAKNVETEQDFLDAIERLKKRKPEHPELIKLLKNNKLKINNYTVEREAGKGKSSLKYYIDIKDLIKKSDFHEDSSSEFEKLRESTVNSRESIKKLRKDKAKQQNKMTRMNEAMEKQLIQIHSLSQALFDLIPDESKVHLMDLLDEANKFTGKKEGNVHIFTTKK